MDTESDSKSTEQIASEAAGVIALHQSAANALRGAPTGDFGTNTAGVQPHPQTGTNFGANPGAVAALFGNQQTPVVFPYTGTTWGEASPHLFEECFLCRNVLLTDGEGGTEITTLPCGHRFHRECYRRYRGGGNGRGCPSCRHADPRRLTQGINKKDLTHSTLRYPNQGGEKKKRNRRGKSKKNKLRRNRNVRKTKVMAKKRKTRSKHPNSKKRKTKRRKAK